MRLKIRPFTISKVCVSGNFKILLKELSNINLLCQNSSPLLDDLRHIPNIGVGGVSKSPAVVKGITAHTSSSSCSSNIHICASYLPGSSSEKGAHNNTSTMLSTLLPLS